MFQGAYLGQVSDRPGDGGAVDADFVGQLGQCQRVDPVGVLVALDADNKQDVTFDKGAALPQQRPPGGLDTHDGSGRAVRGLALQRGNLRLLGR